VSFAIIFCLFATSTQSSGLPITRNRDISTSRRIINGMISLLSLVTEAVTEVVLASLKWNDG